jgi:hypothetical protein
MVVRFGRFDADTGVIIVISTTTTAGTRLPYTPAAACSSTTALDRSGCGVQLLSVSTPLPPPPIHPFPLPLHLSFNPSPSSTLTQHRPRPLPIPIHLLLQHLRRPNADRNRLLAAQPQCHRAFHRKPADLRSGIPDSAVQRQRFAGRADPQC